MIKEKDKYNRGLLSLNKEEFKKSVEHTYGIPNEKEIKQFTKGNTMLEFDYSIRRSEDR